MLHPRRSLPRPDPLSGGLRARRPRRRVLPGGRHVAVTLLLLLTGTLTLTLTLNLLLLVLVLLLLLILGPGRFYSPRHPTHLNPRGMSWMASHDAASNICQVLARHVIGPHVEPSLLESNDVLRCGEHYLAGPGARRRLRRACRFPTWTMTT